MSKAVVTTGAIRRAKLQSHCHHQQANTQLFTGQMPFLSPNQQCQSTEVEKVSYSLHLLIPSSLGIFQPSLWPVKVPGYHGESCQASKPNSSSSNCYPLIKKISPVGDWRSTSLEWPRPWPWFQPYGIPSCITHWPLPTYQISLRSE